MPRGTRKGTNVDVQFDYKPDGRLTIKASLPELERELTMSLNRAAGLDEADLELWMSRLDEGLSDSMLSELPEESNEQENDIPDSIEERPDDRPKPTDVLKLEPVEQESRKETPTNSAKLDYSTIKDDGAASFLAESKSAFSADDAAKILAMGATPQQSETPQLNIGDSQETPKADASDLQALASLQGLGAKPAPPAQPGIPSIVTNPGENKEEKGKPKKSGLFRRRKG